MPRYGKPPKNNYMQAKTAQSPKLGLSQINDALFTLKDGASLAVFRISIGILVLIDIAKGYPFYDSHEFKASYYGFSWVKADPTLIGMFEFLLPITALLVTVGFLYRIAMPLTALMATYFFLIAPAYYLNHYYMLVLFLILLSVVPAHRAWSVDAYLNKRKNKDNSGVPYWSYLLLKLQTEIILIYAGLVKINYDWLQLQPIGTWLRLESYGTPFQWLFYFNLPIIIGAYGVILLHVIGAPLLFYKKTRIWVFALYVCFHYTNSQMFDIGIFPYMTVAATLLFFAPDWPRQFAGKILRLKTQSYSAGKTAPKNKWVLPACTLWLTWQALNPLPALIAPNLQVSWRGHGDAFTWRMMLNDRRIFNLIFVAYIPKENTIEFIDMRKHMGDRQCFMTAWKPNATVQFAHYLDTKLQEKYKTDDVQIHAYITLGINGREGELWADPTKDLSTYKVKYGTYDWQTYATKPLRSWKEMANAPKHVSPAYKDVLKEMNLPATTETIIFNSGNVSLDAPLEKSRCH